MDLGSNLKGIIFDLDGTLFELAIDWEGLRQRVAEALGTSPGSFNEMLQKAAGPQKDLVTRLVDEAELAGAHTGSVLPHAAETITLLSKHYKVAVVTSNGRLAAEAALQKVGLHPGIVIARDDVENIKPHPEGIELALARLELKPAEVIVVGDTSNDLKAAKTAGLKCIIVKNNYLQYAPEGADAYIKTLQELVSLVN